VSAVNVVLRVRHDKRDELLQTVQSMQDNLKQTEAGLMNASLYQDLNDTSVFHLVEEWTTTDAMERYLRSDRFGVLMGALKVLCTEAEVTYQLISGKLGKKISEV
jgi:quinol monooxygenase YgiN